MIKGINIIEIGIRIWNDSSNLNELEIQYRLELKKPKPKDKPAINNFLLFLFDKIIKLKSTGNTIKFKKNIF